MTVEYKGVDITDSVDVSSCVIDSYAEEHGDTMTIEFNDVSSLWDLWSPTEDDLIRVYKNNVDSGAMYVREMTPGAGKYKIRASALPLSARSQRSQGWEKITKLQLAKDIADRHGLVLKTYGVTDRKFYYLRQVAQNDFNYFEDLCVIEGDAFIVYDGNLILYNVEYLESVAPVQQVSLDETNEYEYTRQTKYAGCLIRNASTSYTYKPGTTDYIAERKINAYIASAGDAERYAKNMYRYLNRLKESGYFYIGLADGYSAGSVMSISTKNASSFDGNIFIYHIRHDLVNNKSKVFFRVPEVVE